MGKSRRESEDDRRDRKRKEKEEKMMRKKMETPEEKRKRRMEKKAKKHRNTKKETVLAGYTNENNPFGDSNLTETFTWKLREDKRKREGRDRETGDKRERIKERLDEIEKVKERRKQREIERREWEEERARLQRDQDILMHEDWEKQEEEFHWEQAKRRSEIRINEGRAKPIDFLYKNLNCKDDDFDFSLGEPHLIFNSLTLEELDDLKGDIGMYLSFAKDKDRDFWQCLDIVCNSCIEQLEQQRQMQRGGVSDKVQGDIDKIFLKKTSAQLRELEQNVKSKIAAGGAIDYEYWESLLKRLRVQMAKTKLTEMHTEMLEKRLVQLEQLKGTEQLDLLLRGGEKAENDEEEVSAWDVDEGGDMGEDDGCYSPEMIQDYDESEAIDEQEDLLELERQRKEILQKEVQKLEKKVSMQKKGAGVDSSAAALEMYSREQETGFDEDETQFDEEILVESKTYSWHDKYRPRKPRYFNRVHTGFEWNKYNSTHYDHDNPPPKIVQGYKFNVFYPDLLDKSNPPRYVVEAGPTKDYSILRFTAGPPYEDIAFQIVNREWETNPRHGFKCQFKHGVLSLWFNFRRFRYRR